MRSQTHVLVALATLIPLSASAEEYVRVIEDGANIRTGPSISATAIGTANKGDVFEVYQTSGDWTGIFMFSGEDRYIQASFLQPTTTVPPLPTAEETREAWLYRLEAR